MLEKYLKILSNPLLYYTDKSGKSVFKNYCLFNGTGSAYDLKISKENIGKTLEYRIELDKKLKLAYILIPLFLYLIFIHIKCTLLSILFFEFLWILLANGARLYCSQLYSTHLKMKFGKYEIVAFEPQIPKNKSNEYLAFFKSKIIIIAIAIAIFFAPAFLVSFLTKLHINSGRRFPQAVSCANFYFALYPKTERIYDMRALAKAAQHDYEGALKDYKSVLNMSSKRFSKRDFARFANLLYLQKKCSTVTEAVDVFNEFLTRKRLSNVQNSQMLWLKSMFKIENNYTEGIAEEYDEIIEALGKNDAQKFYLMCDKAYLLYLMSDYSSAINVYNVLISYAENSNGKYAKEISTLYAERGFARKRFGDFQGADQDFLASKIPPKELGKYEPSYTAQTLVVDKF